MKLYFLNLSKALQDIRSEINVTLFEKMGEAALEVLQPRSLSFEDQGKIIFNHFSRYFNFRFTSVL